jgi:glycosyltransferase involved in cell wall biosynthesis
MLTKTRHLLNQTNRDSNKIRILTWPTHEAYQTLLSNIPNVEWHIFHNGAKTWDYHTKPLPKNTYLYFTDPRQIRGELCFDMILSQERATQLPMSINLGQQLGIPVIHIDHTEPYPNLSKKNLDNLKSLKADYHVSISEHNKNTWNSSALVIPHGIDTNIFKPINGVKNYDGLNISNHFAGRDVFLGHTIFQEVSKKHKINVVGFNPQTPEYHRPISNSEDLNKIMNQHLYYINTTQLSPLPMSLLEAASAGMSIVTTNKQEIDKYFKDGENCLIANTSQDFIDKIELIKKDKILATRIGLNARLTILSEFSLQKFIERWSSLINNIGCFK